MRIFITGITGAGKTTLARRLVEEDGSGLRFVEFDKYFDYDDFCRGNLRVYEVIRELEHMVMDAIPTIGADSQATFERFLKDSRNIDTKIVVVTCARDIWLRDRVPNKRDHLKSLGIEPASIAEYCQWYDTFHGNIPVLHNCFSPLVTRFEVYRSDLNLIYEY
jgi:hypothetical protein